MAGIQIDMSEVRSAAADLRAGGLKAARQAGPVVAASAKAIEAQLKAEAGQSSTLNFSADISFDLLDGGLAAEIGPVRGGKGSLANIGYFGGSNGGGGTIPDPIGALEAEAPTFADAIAELAERVIFG